LQYSKQITHHAGDDSFLHSQDKAGVFVRQLANSPSPGFRDANNQCQFKAGVLVPVPVTNRPWASVLQTESKHHALHGLFIFPNPLLKASFHRVLLKTKTPLRGCLLSV